MEQSSDAMSNTGSGDRPPPRYGTSGSVPNEPLKTVVTQRNSASGRNRGVFSVTAGSDPGAVLSIPVGQVVTLGRSDECVFRFDDASLSRVHARVIRVGNDYIFQDAGSTNGSYVNDQPAKAAVTLRDGDRVQLGANTTLRFSLVDEAEEQAMKKVYESAMKDGLTGTYNRKAMESRLEAEIAHALRTGAPLSVVIIDIDHFKKVNDTYGHLGGDAVLKNTANVFAQGLRQGEFLARYGGEEFLIILRGAMASDARGVAERLRVAVESSPVIFENSVIRVTSSAGVAGLDECGDRLDRATLIGIADSRLYQAKQSGRNRVIGP